MRFYLHIMEVYSDEVLLAYQDEVLLAY